MNIDKTGQNNQTTTFNTRSANAGSRTYQLVLTGIFAAVTAVCSWISIPLPSMIPINLAILGVLLSAGCLGFKCGSMSQIIYVLLGAIGVPVFAGFSGGFHVIAGPTGGFIYCFYFFFIVLWLCFFPSPTAPALIRAISSR